MYAIGLDIGGTKIAAALVDEQGRCSFRKERQSIANHKETMFEQVVSCIQAVIKDARCPDTSIVGIGAGVPGKVDAKRGVAVLQNNLPWRNFPLIQRLQEHFPFPITMDNDVAMAAYGEWSKAGKNMHDTLVYLTWSTGISSYTIHKGEPFRGSGFAGEIGLAYFDKQRLETIASGPSINKRCSQQLNRSITNKEVMTLLKESNGTVTEVIKPVLQSFAKGVYAIICLLDPQKLVLGGSILINNPFLLELIKEELSFLVIPEQLPSLDTLAISSLNGDNGLIGAGCCVFNQHPLNLKEQGYKKQ